MAEENSSKEVVEEVDQRRLAISASVRVIPHFPKPGIMFNDITTMLLFPRAFQAAIDLFVERYHHMNISAVADYDPRTLQQELKQGVSYLLLQSHYKLGQNLFLCGNQTGSQGILGEVIQERYELEYGTDCLEMHVGALQSGERVVIIDDIVATGGTLSAAIRLAERAGADVVECACVIGLPKFKVCTVQGKSVFVLIDPVS